MKACTFPLVHDPLAFRSQRFIEVDSMSFSALLARCARSTPRKFHITLPLLIMGLLYWLSSLPGTPLPDDPAAYALFYWISPSLQNALHVPAYAALAFAWRWALAAWLRPGPARAIGAFAIACAYGVLDEWHQSFVPGRYASLTDIALDVAGAVVGVWLASWIASSDQAANASMTTTGSRRLE
jgi:VanZ family protein